MFARPQREVAGAIRSQADLRREMIHPDLAQREHFEIVDRFDVKVPASILQIRRVDEQAGLRTLQRQLAIVTVLDSYDLANF